MKPDDEGGRAEVDVGVLGQVFLPKSSVSLEENEKFEGSTTIGRTPLSPTSL